MAGLGKGLEWIVSWGKTLGRRGTEVAATAGKASRVAGEGVRTGEQAAKSAEQLAAEAEKALGGGAKVSQSGVKASVGTADDIFEEGARVTEEAESVLGKAGVKADGRVFGGGPGGGPPKGPTDMKSWQKFTLGVMDRSSLKGWGTVGLVGVGLASGRGVLGVGSYTLMGHDILKEGAVPTVNRALNGEQADKHSLAGGLANNVFGDGTAESIEQNIDDVSRAIRNTGRWVGEMAHDGKEHLMDLAHEGKERLMGGRNAADEYVGEGRPEGIPASQDLTEREARMLEVIRQQQREMERYEQYGGSALMQQSRNGSLPLFNEIGNGIGDLLGGLYNNKQKALDVGGLVAAAWMFMGKHNFLVKIAGLLLGNYSLKNFKDHLGTEQAPVRSQAARVPVSRQEVDDLLRENFDRNEVRQQTEDNRQQSASRGMVYNRM